MRIIHFDFTINFGGAPQGTVYLAMRLNQFLDVHILDAYGACKAYCDKIRAAGISLHILAPQAKRHYIGFSTRPFKRMAAALLSLPDLLSLRRSFINKVDALKPSAIWVNNEKSLVFAASCLRLRNIPLIVYLRNWATPDQISYLFRWLLKNKVNAIIVHSRATYTQIVRMGISEGKISYAPNVIDPQEVSALSKRPPDLPLPGMPKQIKILLPAARPVHEKGHLTAVKALSRIRKAGVDAVLWFPGKIAAGVDASFVRFLDRKIAELGLLHVVKYIGWRDDMPAVIKCADIIILPTHTEGFPRVVLEAAILRKPVCATPVGGIPEVIDHDRTGLLFPVDDDHALARHILRLSADPAYGQKLADAAFERVLKDYSPIRNTEIVKSVFYSCSTFHRATWAEKLPEGL